MYFMQGCDKGKRKSMLFQQYKIQTADESESVNKKNWICDKFVLSCLSLGLLFIIIENE